MIFFVTACRKFYGNRNVNKYDKLKTFKNFLINILSKFIGSPLMYTWEANNTKGYMDVFLMAFNDLKPDFLILSEGSQLKLFFLEQK